MENQSQSTDLFSDRKIKKEIKGLIDRNFPPVTSKKVVSTVTRFLKERGDVTRWDHKNLVYLPSINNHVFRFLSDGKDYVIKVFPSSENGQLGYKQELEGRRFLTKNEIFKDSPEVKLPNVLHAYEDLSTQVIEFIPNLQESGLGIYDKIFQKKIRSSFVSFLVQLNEIRFSIDNKDMLYMSRYSANSAFDIYQNALSRFEKFRHWLKDGKKDQTTFIKWIKENDFISVLDSHFNKGLSLVNSSILAKQIQPDEMRFNWGDVSFQSLPYIEKGKTIQLVPLDLEYSGWDHFSGGVCSFILHHTSEELSLDFKKTFLAKFVHESRLTKEQIAELNARLITGDLLFISRKLTAAIKLANELPNYKFHKLREIQRQGYSWPEVKIREFLAPALTRARQKFLTISD